MNPGYSHGASGDDTRAAWWRSENGLAFVLINGSNRLHIGAGQRKGLRAFRRLTETEESELQARLRLYPVSRWSSPRAHSKPLEKPIWKYRDATY
jgi:hypothetical protein